MDNILKIKQTENLKFSNDEFKVVNKEDDKLKFVGEFIAEYITSSIYNFNNEHKSSRNDREFIFVYNDYSDLDSFSEAKNKIELFSYKFNNENEFNFIIYLFKLIKSIETNLDLSIKPKKDGYFSFVYKHGELVFTFKFYPDSNTKLVIFEYKGNKLVEFSEYIDFGIKIVEYVHPIFSTWDIKIEYNVSSFATLWTAYLNDIKMDTVIISKISELESYIENNM